MEEEVVNASEEAVMMASTTAPAQQLGEAVTSVTQNASTFFHWIKTFITWENLFKVVGIVVFVLLLFLVYKIAVRAIKKIPPEKLSTHKSVMLVRGIRYLYYFVVIMYVLGAFGVKISAIWGAAGVAGVALAFAAQTSVSNIISGLFVLTEGALKIGDTIIVGDITGIVDAISLLSVRVHTYDNQMVRIPNSTIINSNLTNNSYHKQRRMTINVSIAYENDMTTALEALKKVPAYCPTVLADPAPAVWFDGFGDSGINMTIAVWFKPADFLQTKNDVYIAIKKVFDEAKISIPFNQLDVMIKK